MWSKNTLFLSSDYIVYIRDFALSKGIAAKTLVESNNVGLDILLSPPERVSAQIFHELGGNLFDALKNPYEGVIEFGRGMALPVHGSLGVAVQGANNLNEVVQLAAKYYLTRANFRTLELLDGPDFCNLRLTEGQTEYDNYFSLATLMSFEHAIIHFLRHHSLQNKGIIHLKVNEPDFFPWKMVQNLQIKFGQEYNELLIPNQWMALPINANNPELASLATDQCQNIMEELSPKDLVNEIRQRLKMNEDKPVSLDEMAKLLYVSSSTLQRRLREFDTTYKDIKLEERLLAAKRLLSNETMTVEYISERLGFSDASSFTKSFKALTGLTPSAYRKKLF